MTDTPKEEPQAEPPEIAELRKKAAERDELFDKYCRAVADYQNLRKRMEKDISSRSEDLVLDLVQGMILVLDHLELALRSSGNDAEGAKPEGLAQGVQLIRSEIETLLTKQGVSVVPTQGMNFDPKCHEAVIQEKKEGSAPGAILEEIRKGYRWRERILRPAQVKIAKGEE